jgi:hypothetical protein
MSVVLELLNSFARNECAYRTRCLKLQRTNLEQGKIIANNALLRLNCIEIQPNYSICPLILK